VRRRAEPFLPALLLLAFLGVAIVLGLLLNNAQERGVDALEDLVDGEVQAIARSQDQRIATSLSNTSGLSNPSDPFELVERSAADLAQLEELVDLASASLRGGFYLLDADATITQGVLFTGDPIGTTFEWPGYDELVATPTFAQGRSGILPVSQGLTTGQPALAYVLPIIDDDTGELRGSFVLESVVAQDSAFNQEIAELRRGETGTYLFFDATGVVIASNDSSLLAEPLDDERYLELPAGPHRLDGDLVVLADVESADWRVVFRQDAGEFESALSRPLESVGRITVFVLLGAGGLLTFLLSRRLRAARAEQARLEAISETQQEFVSIVSHELRTPVAGVLGFLETSLDHWDAMDDAERRSAVGRAASNARRLQSMTRDVLDTQSLESGRLVHVLTRVDLAAEVRDAVAAARDLDAERAVEVIVPDGSVWVSADADRIQQVLANLLDNARKNSPAVEPVEVELRVVDDAAEVRVSDRGAGITEESLERIFDKFVRGRGESVTGTGLGLYISRQIIHAHHGRIWAESPPGEGATFRFVLPLAADEADRPTA
jgi:signal transduction histidine kinase